MIIKTKKPPKNIEKYLINKIKKTSLEEMMKELSKDIKKITDLSIPDQISLIGFFEYLISPEEDKIFATTENSLIAKHKEILEKKHNCKITIIKRK